MLQKVKKTFKDILLNLFILVFFFPVLFLLFIRRILFDE